MVFLYTIHSIINYNKLPPFIQHKNKIMSLVILKSVSSNKKSKKITYKKAIYKSKHVNINTFPSEIILSIKDTKDTDIYTIIYNAQCNNKSETLIPEWYTILNPMDYKTMIN